VIFIVAYFMSIAWVVGTFLLFQGEIVFFDVYLTLVLMWLLSLFLASLTALWRLVRGRPLLDDRGP
jgi:hypothetical protein